MFGCSSPKVILQMSVKSKFCFEILQMRFVLLGNVLVSQYCLIIYNFTEQCILNCCFSFKIMNKLKERKIVFLTVY
jgi:hypothetical protein